MFARRLLRLEIADDGLIIEEAEGAEELSSDDEGSRGRRRWEDAGGGGFGFRAESDAKVPILATSASEGFGFGGGDFAFGFAPDFGAVLGEPSSINPKIQTNKPHW